MTTDKVNVNEFSPCTPTSGNLSYVESESGCDPFYGNITFKVIKHTE